MYFYKKKYMSTVSDNWPVWGGAEWKKPKNRKTYDRICNVCSRISR